MTEIEEKKYIASQLTPDLVSSFRVTIIIGRATKVFKQIYKDPLYTVTKAEEVRTFLAEHTMPHDKPIVFEDLALMTPNVQAYLLKFIEEPPAPLIILASADNVSPIILSRCRNIIKLPCQEVPKFKSLNEFVSRRLELQDQFIAARRLGESMPVDDLYELEHPEEFSLLDCPLYAYKTTELRLSKNNITNIDKYLKLL